LLTYVYVVYFVECWSVVL